MNCIKFFLGLILSTLVGTSCEMASSDRFMQEANSLHPSPREDRIRRANDEEAPSEKKRLADRFEEVGGPAGQEADFEDIGQGPDFGVAALDVVEERVHGIVSQIAPLDLDMEVDEIPEVPNRFFAVDARAVSHDYSSPLASLTPRSSQDDSEVEEEVVAVVAAPPALNAAGVRAEELWSVFEAIDKVKDALSEMNENQENLEIPTDVRRYWKEILVQIKSIVEKPFDVWGDYWKEIQDLFNARLRWEIYLDKTKKISRESEWTFENFIVYIQARLSGLKKFQTRQIAQTKLGSRFKGLRV